MHLFITALLLTIITSLTMAEVNQCAGTPSTKGHCTTTSATDLTLSFPSSLRVTTAQCQTTCGNILSDPGEWQVDFRSKPSGYTVNMVSSACGFTVGQDGKTNDPDYYFKMHNQDIVDILDTASGFAKTHGGRVVANGTMVCDGKAATWFVHRLT